MSALPNLPFVVLDTETTGFVPRVNKVIEFASAEVRDGKLTREYEQLFASDDVPAHVEVLTRIRQESLRGKPTFDAARAEVTAHLPEDALIVGQNVLFDIGMLKGEGIDLSERPWIDTSMLASLVFPELHSYSLGYLSKVLNLKHDPPHRALGDVRATLELLGKCWERLCMLPPDMLAQTKATMANSSPGYRILFAALPEATATTPPPWAHMRQLDEIAPSSVSLAMETPTKDIVELREEPLDPQYLQAMLRGALADPSARHWIAVKNLRAILRRLPADLHTAIHTGTLRVLYAPSFLLNDTAAQHLAAQETFTADEATLALKLAWYMPTRRDQLPMHGGEDAVWNGKLACTDSSPAYVQQFTNIPGVVLLDHRELLRFLELAEHPGRRAMESQSAHIIIDDASMLEDTATKAFGWQCYLNHLRAAAEGDSVLTRITDIIQLWIEKIRQEQDIRYITDGDVRTPEARGLREQLEEILKQQWSERTREALECIARVLDPAHLDGRISWIELKPNGTQMLQSVPERIGSHLTKTLYGKHPVSLLIPGGCAQKLPEILPDSLQTAVVPLPTTEQDFANTIPLSLQPEPTLDAVLRAPPTGKTIILLPGKGMIEDLYVKHTEILESQGITLICQGLNGGQGRMQAEFLAAEGTVLWMLTPWMFEGLELPPASVDHLLIKTLPFDHPSHPVFSRRAARYRNAFGEYSLPRLLHRLFRVLRTFARFRTPAGDARAMDDRLFSKSYGKEVCAYLKRFAAGTVADPVASVATETAPKPAKKPRAKKPAKLKDQLSMF